MHELQKILLKRLSSQNDQRYATLTANYDFEDNIVFHLNKLLSANLISKDNGIYSITPEGIREISKYEPFDLENKGVKTFFIGFVCSDNKGNYLLKAHLQARANFYNLPSGKPYFSESIGTALTRTFYENTGLTLTDKDFTFRGLHMKTIQTSSGEVLFDDAFTIFNVTISSEEKKHMKLADPIRWFSIPEISALENKWPEIEICVLENDKSTYKTYTHISDYIL